MTREITESIKKLNKLLPNNIVIHIGMTKAGSTAIQNAFEKNHSFLLRNGILFPKSISHGNPFRPHDTPGHEKLINKIMDGDISDFSEELLFAGKNAQKLFISAEHFFLDCSDESYQFLADIFSGKKIEILCILRHQLAWISSRYYQSVTNGYRKETRSFELFSEDLISQGTVNYYERIKHITSIIAADRFIAVDYDDLDNSAGSIRCALDIVGIDKNFPVEISADESNISYPFPEAIEAQRRLNALHHPLSQKEILSWCNQFNAEVARFRLDRSLPASHLKPTPELRERILDACRASNRLLSEEFLGGKLFGPDERTLSPAEPTPLNEEMVGELLKVGIDLLAPFTSASSSRTQDLEKKTKQLDETLSRERIQVAAERAKQEQLSGALAESQRQADNQLTERDQYRDKAAVLIQQVEALEGALAESQRQVDKQITERDQYRDKSATLIQQIGALEAELGQTRNQIESGNRRMDSLNELIGVRERELAVAQAKIEASVKKTISLENDVKGLKDIRTILLGDRDALERHSLDLEKCYRAVLSSTSWRVTGPLRIVTRSVKSLVTGKKSRRNRIPRMPKLSDNPGSDVARKTPTKKGNHKRRPGSPSKHNSSRASTSWHDTGSLSGLLEGQLRRAYDQLPERAKAAVPQTAKDLVKAKIKGRGHSYPLTKKYDDKLWGGFSRSALADLNAIKSNKSLLSDDRAEACYSLARWYAVQGDFAAALKEMEDRREIQPKAAGFKKQFMLEALFLCRLGRGEEARALVERYRVGKSLDVSTQLMLANTWNPEVTGNRTLEAEVKMLEYINSVYRHFGVAEIEKRDAESALTIDNLRGKNVEAHDDPDNKVTVIVPAYNASDTIGTALTSLAEQSWRNIEVLVVDDCSTDNTACVVEEFCKTDDRFRLIRQTVNGGSYACRNRALEYASGKYVTIHDSDDWAHPNRIGYQVAELQRSKGRRYNLSQWARATSDLRFLGTWRPSEKLVSLNMGSLLFERDVVVTIGKWSPVRISSDREYIKRLEMIYGTRREQTIVSSCPLAFGRDIETSLTRNKVTHVATTYHGLRRTYHEVTDAWHTWQKERGLDKTNLIEVPNLCFPHTIRSQKSSTEKLDLLFMADFCMRGGTYHSAMNMIRAAKLAGLTVGLFHYRRYDLDVTEALDPKLIEFALKEDIRIVAPGEQLEAANIIITHPPILNHFMDLFPIIEGDRIIVVINQMAERDVGKADVAYDPAIVRANLKSYFGQEGDWVPISGLVRRIMESDPRYPKPHRDTWTPMVNVDEWFVQGPIWRGKDRQQPVVGRHGRDHRLKWPGERDTLLAAYCANKPCEMRFLGGARHAETLVGGLPANWTVEPFGARDAKVFLADLDFFIHYPHEDYIEEFGRAPMEAMAIGVPVILPPVFRETFGDAALYAEPQEVWSMIDTLWRDEVAWMARVKAGREFVQKNCSYDNFARRLTVGRFQKSSDLSVQPEVQTL